MAIGLRIKIDVQKIQKELLYKGEKGTYLDATVFVNNEPDQYGQHGAITQDRKKDDGGDKIYIGNVKRFWSDEGQQEQPPDQYPSGNNDDDDVPF